MQEAVTTEEKNIAEEGEVNHSETKSQSKTEALDPHKAFVNKLESYKMINEDKFEQYFDCTSMST